MMKVDSSAEGPPQRPAEPVRQPAHIKNETTTTTTTTTTTSPALTLDWIKFDVEYFKTIPGIIKIIQFIFGILCMALGAPAYFGGTHFFLFVAVIAFIVTTLWICIYFFSIREGLTLMIPWTVLEFYYTGATAVLYGIAMIVQFAVTSGYYDNSGKAAATFGLFNTLAYGAGAFLLFKDWKQTVPQEGNAQNVP